MKNAIELLVKLGLSKEQSISFIKNIAEEAFLDGYIEGMEDKPSASGTLGKGGMNFYEWWKSKVEENT